MAIEGHFDITPSNEYHGDPSLPYFKVSEEERNRMKKEKGLTDEQIDAWVAETRNKQIIEAAKKERGLAA